jgi:hypothetical protein
MIRGKTKQKRDEHFGLDRIQVNYGFVETFKS